MTVPSAKEAYEKWQNVLLKNIPEKHLDAIAMSIDQAINRRMTWTPYYISVEEEDSTILLTKYSLKRTICDYLVTLGYKVDCYKSNISKAWIIKIEWEDVKG